jgi:putative Mg2+ transporter-C (MgtC) family protein
MHTYLFHTALLSINVRLLFALLIGGVIGIERELRGHTAGFRTHILVCLGGCLAAMVDSTFVASVGGRISAQVISGVGFLGAGAIMRSDKGQVVKGLTTAATLWVTAGIGVALGFGPPSMWYAVFASLVVFVTLTVASYLEATVFRKGGLWRIEATLRDPKEPLAIAVLIGRMQDLGAHISTLNSNRGEPESNTCLHVSATVRLAKNQKIEDFVLSLSDIAEVNWDI